MKKTAPIVWSELRLDALPQARREQLGRTWAARMREEHLAVGAFAVLTQELAEDGCDPTVLHLVARAASDEVRHAEVCRAIAAAALGEAAVSAPLRGVPRPPEHADRPPTLRAMLHVVEMCCLNETFTGAYLTEMIARTTDPTARAAVESLLADEIDHGRVGWAYLASRKGDPMLAELATELPRLLERSYTPVVAAARERPEPDDPTLEAFAYLGRDAAASIYRDTLAEVILPGFEACGVDTKLARVAHAS